jgi:hypothetical protein
VDGQATKLGTFFGCALALLLRFASCGGVEIQSAEQKSPAVIKTEEILRTELARLSGMPSSVEARITIGARAFRTALDIPDSRPIIATFLTSTDFQIALNGRTRPASVTAIFSNPDPIDQVQLARLLLGTPRLGAIESPNVAILVASLTAHGVSPIPFARAQNIESTLRGATQMDAIVALPDPAVLNQTNIGHVVRTLYSRRKVLIGYSDTLTRVGSLASVFVTPEALARRTAEVLRRFADNSSLPAPSFVDDVDVSVNEQLARSLNISVPNETALRDAVRAETNGEAP